MKTFKDFMEDAPINNVGGGNIAGTQESGDHPPVRKKKSQLNQLKMPLNSALLRRHHVNQTYRHRKSQQL